MTTNLTGQTLGGYHLLEEVGAGALAVVYKAWQAALDRWVAVKVLRYKEETALLRFEREAKAVARLRHRNIITIYEYAEENDRPYIVMEYVEGGTLRDRLTGQPLAWQTALNLVIPIAEALHYAHQRGLIHRDVKPSNILMPQPDWPLLADFGLVKLPDIQQPVTGPGVSLGTPAYVAPEQVRGLPVDHRADQYALAAVLFELVTGRWPFDYPHPNKILLAHVSEPAPAAHQLTPDCPPALSRVIQTAMAKTPEQRFADMPALLEALQTVLVSTGAAPWFAAAPPPTAEPPSAQQTLVMDRSPALTASRIFIPSYNVTLPLPPQESLIIGRSHQQKLADVDLGPYGAADAGVSRHHARLLRQGGRWLLEDLGSLNGTYLNDERLTPHTPVPVNPGDAIRCSHLAFELRLN